MAIGHELLAEAVESLFALYGGLAGSYVQGSAAAIAVTDAARTTRARSGDDSRMDAQTSTWLIRQADLDAVTPSPGDKWTSDSVEWTVVEVVDMGLGHAWEFRCSRTTRRGAE